MVLGAPIALQDALVNISFLIITVIVNQMGVIASAALGVVEKVIVFAMLPPVAISSAVAAMTATELWSRIDRTNEPLLVCRYWYGIGVWCFNVCLFTILSGKLDSHFYGR